MAYTTKTKVRDVISRRKDPSSLTDDQVDQAIALADSLINSYTNRTFEDTEITETHRGQLHSWGGYYVLLDHWPIKSITSVKNSDGDNVDYEILATDIGKLWVAEGGELTIVYKYNESSVPTEIQNISAEIAANILINPPDFITSDSIPESFTVHEFGPYLTPMIRRILNSYKHYRSMAGG